MGSGRDEVLDGHRLSAADYRQVMTDRFAVRGEVTALDAAD